MSGDACKSRAERVAAACVELADTVFDGFDIADFLYTLTGHAVGLLPTDAVGVILLDPRGKMFDATAWDEATQRLARAQIEWDDGPCPDCTRTGAPIPETALDSPAAQTRWPRFSRWAMQRGLGAVAAVPLRLRAQTIGALNLLNDRPGQLSETDPRLAQSLADAASIGILHQRAVHQKTMLAAQLQTALDSRVVIEQAKGMLAERIGVSLEDAFARLRGHARRTRTRLTLVAGQVIDGSATRHCTRPNAWNAPDRQSHSPPSHAAPARASGRGLCRSRRRGDCGAGPHAASQRAWRKSHGGPEPARPTGRPQAGSTG